LFDRHDEPASGPDAAKPLRITHVAGATAGS
jgi:hypothetical protein